MRIGHLRSSRRLLEALVVGEIDDSPAFRTALGGHENHSVSRTRTVDSRLGILQHIDTLDVIGVDLADVSPFDAVHDDQRRVVARRAPAADEYLRVGSTRITRTGVHDQARKTSRQRGSDINAPNEFILDCIIKDDILIKIACNPAGIPTRNMSSIYPL